MLPLTMVVSVLILSLVIHGIFLLDSERHFFQSSYSVFQLRQLRENAFSELSHAVQEKTLPEKGSFHYEGMGMVTYIVVSNGAETVINLSLKSSSRSQTDQVVFDPETAKITRWQEAINP
jgi:hypothetical protein